MRHRILFMVCIIIFLKNMIIGAFLDILCFFVEIGMPGNSWSGASAILLSLLVTFLVVRLLFKSVERMSDKRE